MRGEVTVPRVRNNNIVEWIIALSEASKTYPDNHDGYGECLTA
jgi:hypothetical protein